jgi:hypothetical protein
MIFVKIRLKIRIARNAKIVMNLIRYFEVFNFTIVASFYIIRYELAQVSGL